MRLARGFPRKVVLRLRLMLRLGLRLTLRLRLRLRLGLGQELWGGGLYTWGLYETRTRIKFCSPCGF